MSLRQRGRWLLGVEAETIALLLALAAVAWLITHRRMAGMDAGPGTDLGALGWYVGIWVTMMAAMMLPSSAPMVVAFARASRNRGDRRVRAATWAFVGGYLAVWTACGLAAYGIFRLGAAAGSGRLAWDRAGPVAAGAAVGAAGLYQMTSLKAACLRRCRSPLLFVVGHWRPGLTPAARLGAQLGVVCVGCCAGLMLVLFAVGVMSVFWMVVVAAAVAAEKLLTRPRVLGGLLGLALVGLGLWIATAPASVPHLTDPAEAATMHMSPGRSSSPPARIDPPRVPSAPAHHDSPMSPEMSTP